MAYNPNFSRDPRGNFESHINDSFVSVVGGTDAILLEDELNEMQWIQSEARASFVRKTIPTGVMDFLSGLTVPNNQNELGVGSGNTSHFNQFFVRGFKANMHGYELPVFGNNSQNDLNTIILDQPPSQSITVAMNDSARDDFVFLEAWFQKVGGNTSIINQYGGSNSPIAVNDIIDPRVGSETTERVQLQWRVRIVNGVDFSLHPEGLKTKDAPWDTRGVRVTPQGPNLTAVSYDTNNKNITQLHQLDSSVDTNMTASGQVSDPGLFVAGDGTTTSMTLLNTFDGYIYAMPLFRIRRRNTQPFNVDTNRNGGRGYPGNMTVSQAVATGATTIYVQTVDINLQKGDQVSITSNGTTTTSTVTSIDTTNNLITVDKPMMSASSGTPLVIVSATSDRPDGLFNNIVDASDIIDLRHLVSVHHDYNSIISKNVDLLLRGQLSTVTQAKHDRLFFGIQPFADDINTLILVNFDGNNQGVSNGSTVNPTSAPNISTPVFTPGVAGSGTYIPNGTGKTGIEYNIAMFNPSQSPFTVEFFFKPGNWGGVADSANDSHFLFSMFDQGGNEVLSLYRDNYISTSNYFSARYTNASGTVSTLTGAGSQLAQFINAGEWHYLKFINDPTSNSVSFQIDEDILKGMALSIENTNVSSILIGDINGGGDFIIDEFRLSNVVRATTPLPNNYQFLQGDRIIDGPSGNKYHFADDNVLPSGAPDNPTGMPYVPLNVYNPVWLNNTLIRHYVGAGLTPGWSRTQNGVGDSVGESMMPDGRMEGSAEYQWINSNETADGTRDTFSINVPSNIQGKALLSNGNFNSVARVTTGAGTSTVVPSAMNINGSVVQFTLSTPPAAGAVIQFIVFSGDTHVHYIPSTRGFEIHGWNNQSFTISYLSDPTEIPVVTPVNYTGGSLATGITYYVRYTFTTPYGETLASQEASITLPNGYNAINASISAMPNNATGIKWYLSTSSNTETYNATSTTNAVNLVASSAAGANGLPTVSTAQLTSRTLQLNQDISSGVVNVINHVRVTLAGDTKSWFVPSAGYAQNTVGGPNTSLPSWSATDSAGNAQALPHDNVGLTFSGNLPVGSVVEVYYEYSYVPQIGDTVKLFVKHPSFQGLLKGQLQERDLVNGQLLTDVRFVTTTEGSGKVDSLTQNGNVYRLNRMGPAVANLPLPCNSNVLANLKCDSLETFATVMTEFSDMKFIGNSVPANGNSYDDPWYVPGRKVAAVRTSVTNTDNSLIQVINEYGVTSEGRADFLIKNLATAVPTLGIMLLLVRDNGRVRLIVCSTYNSGQLVNVSSAWDATSKTSNANIFELVGRPLLVEDFWK